MIRLARKRDGYGPSMLLMYVRVGMEEEEESKVTTLRWVIGGMGWWHDIDNDIFQCKRK